MRKRPSQDQQEHSKGKWADHTGFKPAPWCGRRVAGALLTSCSSTPGRSQTAAPQTTQDRIAALRRAHRPCHRGSVGRAPSEPGPAFSRQLSQSRRIAGRRWGRATATPLAARRQLSSGSPGSVTEWFCGINFNYCNCHNWNLLSPVGTDADSRRRRVQTGRRCQLPEARSAEPRSMRAHGCRQAQGGRHGSDRVRRLQLSLKSPG
jgi:hypothetical protein